MCHWWYHTAESEGNSAAGALGKTHCGHQREKRYQTNGCFHVYDSLSVTKKLGTLFCRPLSTFGFSDRYLELVFRIVFTPLVPHLALDDPLQVLDFALSGV